MRHHPTTVTRWKAVASVVFSVTTPSQAGVVSLVSLVVVIVVMEGVRKLARSGSVKVEEFFSTNKSRQNVEEVGVEDTDTDTPTTLPILRSFNTKGKVGDSKKEKEKSEGSKGTNDGCTKCFHQIYYSDPSCRETVENPHKMNIKLSTSVDAGAARET